jgi:hypothetical protein
VVVWTVTVVGEVVLVPEVLVVWTVVGEVVAVTFGQQIFRGHSSASSPSTIFSSSSGLHTESDSHSKTGQPVSLSVPEQRSLEQTGHSGVGRGLQIVDWHPHSSVVSTIISHGRQEATLMAGQSRSTQTISAGQQHSVPSMRLTVF